MKSFLDWFSLRYTLASLNRKISYSMYGTYRGRDEWYRENAREELAYWIAMHDECRAELLAKYPQWYNRWTRRAGWRKYAACTAATHGVYEDVMAVDIKDIRAGRLLG